jgi:hypothetical protein
MADHMAAEIHIGGKVRRSVVQALCTAINEAGASLKWGDGHFRPETADDLLAARREDGDSPRLLKLFDDEALWGEFADLEKFLRGNGIAFCRWSDGKYECDPEAEAFHPDCGPLWWLTNHERQPIVPASELAPIEAKLTGLLELLQRGKAASVEVLAQVERIRNELRAQLPPVMPPLESLEIVEG